ncbi:hypothetical protein QNI19_33260 [Cytophagaceae bacterium DM2B3-1]|uniref:Uncharacterized protein n=1 Tax=Xanthocytophaga flava TaxID=3048013 RepID=A0ABT7CY66_9BACT|nr:hypothetical protein [Xanthocytophaga flavus]MDJ1497857.1 hypothetical protein [Xanthocytophaga flavus]
MNATGFYEDILTTEDGKWKFPERKFTLIYFANVPVNGQVTSYKKP